MKHAAFLTLAVVLAAACHAQTKIEQTQPDAKVAEKAVPAPPNPAAKMLSARLASVDFEETPFDKVVEDLARMTNTNIVVFWNRLREEDIDRTTPVTLKVRNLPFDRVLKLVLDQIRSEDGLVFSADQDLIMISTAKDFKGKMAVRVYDVRWIIQPTPYPRRSGDDGGGDPNKPPDIVSAGSMPPQLVYDREATLKRPLLNRFMKQDEEDRQQGYDKLQRDPERLMLDLVNLITAAVEPTSWDINGGRGTVVPYRGNLIINNSLLVHSKLGEAIGDSTPMTAE